MSRRKRSKPGRRSEPSQPPDAARPAGGEPAVPLSRKLFLAATALLLAAWLAFLCVLAVIR